MKFRKLNIFFLTACFLLFSCSSDSESEQEYDFSFLVNKQWKRVQFNISMEFDFNLDGVASSDMINEFDCLANVSLVLTTDNRFDYNADGLILSTTALDPTNPNYSEQYSCDEDGFGPNFFGTFTMLDENTFKIERDPMFDDIYENEFIATFNFVDNRLIQSHTRRYPVSYDEENQVYNYEMIVVEEIFEYE